MRRPQEQQQYEPPPRVAAYCRYSDEGQNPRSVVDQLKVCRRFAERMGWPAIRPDDVFRDEAISGGTVQRTEYQRLLAAIAGSNGRPPFDVVLIEDFSRLMRDLEETGRLQKMAPIWGVRVINVSSGRDITDVAAAYEGISNEQYLKDLHRRIRRGLGGRFEDGFHAGGSVFGYTSVPVPHPSGRLDRFGKPMLLGRRLEPDPAEAAVVRRIFTEAAAGLPPKEIAFCLDRDGVPKPCHKYQNMTKGACRKMTPWNPGTVAAILRNERYRGRWRWQKTICVGKLPTGKKVMRPAHLVPEAETLEQEREELRLIDDALWEKVQEILDARAEGVLKDPKTGRLQGREKGCAPGQVFGKNTTPLNGLLRCGVCGGPVAVIMSKRPGPNRRPPVDAKFGHKAQGLTRYLGCLHRHHFKGRCANAGVCRLADLEAALQDALRGYFSDRELRDAHFRRFQEALHAHQTRRTAQEQQARAEIAAAEVEIERVKAAILRGVIGETTARMLQDAEAKRATAEKALEAAEAARAGEPRLVPPQEILRELYAQRLQEQRQAYRRLLSEVRLRSERKPGRRMVTRWTAEIVPRPEAGIVGLPGSVAFGKEVITVGSPPSGRGDLSACAGG